tara:strand:+ start:7407 stop:8531 length:1125 start_codon:yes stop_codon:yes gene_type:complete
MRQCLYLLPIGLSLLLVACSEKNGSDEDREDGGQETPVAKSRALQGPWDDVVFTKHSSYACQSLDGTRTQFPELINDDWDYEALEEIPIDYIAMESDVALQNLDHGPAACVWAFFEYFSEHDAYYEESDCADDHGELAHAYERSLFSAGMISLPLLKLRNDSYIREADWQKITSWLRKLLSCEQVTLEDRLNHYTAELEGLHNSIYNAALAGASLAILLDDEEAFVYFMDGFKIGLDQLNDDGTSSYEVAYKAGDALFYHNLIVNYATHIALLSDLGDYDFLNHAKLKKMRRLVLDDLDGAGYLEQQTGVSQTRHPKDEPWNLSWTYHMNRIQEDELAEKWADDYANELGHSMTAGEPREWWVPNSALRQKDED